MSFASCYAAGRFGRRRDAANVWSICLSAVDYWPFGRYVYFRRLPGASGGQKNKKTKKSDASSQPAPPANLTPESDQIDNDIGEMLAAFQLGNVDMMHKYYADNVTFVSADYEPPVVGWQNYAPLYERQRAAFQAIQLNRRNTLVFIHGDVAWAEYQMAVRFDVEWPALFDARTDHPPIQQGGHELADPAQPHLAALHPHRGNCTNIPATAE